MVGGQLAVYEEEGRREEQPFKKQNRHTDMGISLLMLSRRSQLTKPECADLCGKARAQCHVPRGSRKASGSVKEHPRTVANRPNLC